jgi:peptide-methionine (S)-S-oxide reductase
MEQPGEAGRSSEAETRSITLGGGCFWCTEAVFLDVEGVVAVEPGYAGGHVANPSYEAVCTGETGHAEVVRLTYDPARIGLPAIFAIFFTIHDPTTVNRQGHDVGTQYRSVIFYHDDKVFADPIVTEVAPLSNYSTAEPYHHRYFERHPGQGYCTMVVAPKLAKFRKVHAGLRRQ